MRLQGRLVPAAALATPERDQMFALMDRHYEGVCRAAFDADLAEKDWVIEVLDPRTGQLCGFSTQMLLAADVGGRPVEALFSGDTIVDRERWGDTALAHVWGRLALALIDAAPAAERYWFLISKGYKTYRFLPLFFREFYPRHGAPTPPWAREVIDGLGRHKFGPGYDDADGVVRGGAGKDRLRAGVADVTPGRLRDPDVEFFARRNPGHARGDELCCLAPLTRANFTPAAYRVIGPEPAPAGVRA
jgi:hypothetical protein